MLCVLTTKYKDFPGGPVVKSSPSSAEGTGSIPGWRAKTVHTSGPKNQNIKQKQYCKKFHKDFKNGPHLKSLKKKKKRYIAYLLCSQCCARGLVSTGKPKSSNITAFPQTGTLSHLGSSQLPKHAAGKRQSPTPRRPLAASSPLLTDPSLPSPQVTGTPSLPNSSDSLKSSSQLFDPLHSMFAIVD